ncbi:unnamed protein product [Closterium sp. Yama58-4]|nr:unnamed protein product [Closterium sp. Yama58-4]
MRRGWVGVSKICCSPHRDCPIFHSRTMAWIAIGVALSSLFATVIAEPREVTIGSAIKLVHDRLKHRLHSHEVSYGSGSGQQSVTGFQGGDDGNSYWIVRCINKIVCEPGQTLGDGAVFRLQHMRTRRWLHSHLHASPLSNNFEVSAYGDDNQSDTGDHWRLEIEGRGTLWMRDQKVRLQHVDTGGYLHSHNKQYGRPIAGQYEICGIQRKSPENIWKVTEGVYFPATTEVQTD